MANYSDIFKGAKHTVFPVVHVTNRSQCLDNVKVACAEGADGVFLINHSIAWDSLLTSYKAAIQAFPGFWIGVNFLDLTPMDAVRTAAEEFIEGLWLDNCTDGQQLRSWQEEFNAERTVLFGGVAFKYQPQVDDVGEAARTATGYADVITTSGSRTGIPPEVSKIKAMREAIGTHPLGIASGISAANVTDYLPYTDTFLVATHISKSRDQLDSNKLRELVKQVHG